MATGRSVEFFEAQFQNQVRAGQFALNPFEQLALEHAGGTVLDLGCGLGNLALELGRRGARVTAVDGSATAIERIARAAVEERLAVEAACVDLGAWSIPHPYETIIAIGLLMFFPRERAHALLDAIRDNVLPGGRAVINVLVEGTTYLAMFEPGRYHLFCAGEVEERLPGFEILLSRRDDFPAPGDTRKQFVTVVARRPG